jgi:hypothetical protein
VWEIANGGLKPAASEDFSAAYLESDLERWIAESPDLLGDKILIIDRQRDISGVGRLDLLGIDQDGTFVIAELKRDLSSREAVAQALDYASWLNSQSPDHIAALANAFLKHRSLEEAFEEAFQTELPELNCQNHRILLIAARLDASAERIIEYLSERYGVEINAAFFTYSKLNDGKEILARTMLVADDVRPKRGRGARTIPATKELLTTADERQVLPILEVCREAGDLWREECGSSYGGSFIFWTKTTSGKNRSVFGVVPGGNNWAPVGQLVVWIPTKNLSEITDVEQAAIRQLLTEQFQVFDQWKSGECWVRLRTAEEAKVLLGQFKAWSAKANPVSTGE